MLTLYFSCPARSSMAVHIALHEIGAPFEARPLSFARKEHRAPDYLRLNPEGKVPTLLIDGRPLTEVAAILFYLAQALSRGRVCCRAGDIEAEAQVISWMSFIASTIHPARRQRRSTLRARCSASPSGDWRSGSGRSSATRSPTSTCSASIGASRTRCSRRPATFPNLTAHYDRMMARPAVQRTIEVESAIGYDLPA